MNIEEIKRNAPEGATHYNLYDDGTVIYYKKFMLVIAQHAWGEWLETLRLNFDGLKPL